MNLKRIRMFSNLVTGTVVLAICAMLVLSPAVTAENEETDEASPLEIVRENTEKVLEIIRDPEIEGENADEKRLERTREAIEPVFDWRRMGQSALGRHWRERTDEERTEFAELFRKLLERTYWKRIRDNAEAEINYKDEDVDEEEGRAKVRLVAVASGEEEVPISYRLYRLSEEEMKEKKDAPVWLVYDVRVEGVSLIKNYRDQFNDVMVGGSFERLMKMLRKKVEENQ